jgi:hypothetical protein
MLQPSLGSIPTASLKAAPAPCAAGAAPPPARPIKVPAKPIFFRRSRRTDFHAVLDKLPQDITRIRRQENPASCRMFLTLAHRPDNSAPSSLYRALMERTAG